MVRKIRAKLVLQLRAEGLSARAIAASQAMSRKSVTAVLEAADAAGTDWEAVKDRADGEVYALLFPGRGEHHSVFAQPDWEQAHREMARVGVTLKLLHGEYADACATTGEPAMSYDRFCRTYQRHVLVTGAASRVGHKAAQTVEVDWSGPTMQLHDRCRRQASHGVSVRGLLAVQQVRVRRAEPGYDAGFLAAGACGDVRRVRWFGAQGGAGQSQDRGDQASPRR